LVQRQPLGIVRDPVSLLTVIGTAERASVGEMTPLGIRTSVSDSRYESAMRWSLGVVRVRSRDLVQLVLAIRAMSVAAPPDPLANQHMTATAQLLKGLRRAD
jgi:hypothetical protein